MSRGTSLKLPALFVFMALAASCEVGGSKTISVTVAPTSTPSPSPVVNCTGGPYSILVSWSANREKAVNTTGGGYRVYYSTSTPVNTSTASSVNVPYVSGATSPTSVTVTGLSCGTWHFRVVGYSALYPSGSSSTARSADSSEVNVTVP